MHSRSAAPAPSAGARTENLRCHLDEVLLLLRRQLDHAVPLIWIAKRRKNPTVQPKIGVPHVRRFNRSWNTQNQTAEFLGSHTVPTDTEISHGRVSWLRQTSTLEHQTFQFLRTCRTAACRWLHSNL